MVYHIWQSVDTILEDVSVTVGRDRISGSICGPRKGHQVRWGGGKEEFGKKNAKAETAQTLNLIHFCYSKKWSTAFW